ncbi:RNA-guided pseudouridylation complex pseudouridine synthase subunit Cbf5 [Halobacteriales archaeon QH_2_66_30]|nr:MAG: RNA-guided pseudouridylation complex pseudouridine synthase subunit Cbf5 [Halobacteriales archaeon QH_2_66_30]
MTLRDPPGDRSPAALLPFGLVNLDKPPGPSAHQVAEWVRELTRDALADRQESDALDGADNAGHPRALVDRVAHAGTLDPKVTGSLPLMLGDATRLAQVFDDSRKEYVAVLELHGPPPSDFEAIVAEFEGEIYQKPPRKSAVRRQLRVREIFELNVIERRERQALLGIRCESGTYVRKLCHDIGLALGTGAHMGDLRRTATGTFDDTTLVTMEEFVDALAFWVEDDDPEPLEAVVDPAERALVTLPRVTIAPSAAREVAQGAPVYAPGVIDVAPAEVGGGEPTDDALVACYTPNGAAVCLGRLVGDPDADRGTVVDLERVLV